MKRLALLLALFCSLLSHAAVPETGRWASQHFRKGVLPPFSFQLDGRPSSSFLNTWRFSAATRADGTRTYTWTDPKTGLQAICDVWLYPDFDAVEWTLRFRNGGKRNSPTLSQVRSADLTVLGGNGPQTFVLNHLGGSLARKDDFAPAYDPIKPGNPLDFKPLDGRSSSGAFPFFNLIAPPVGAGKEDAGAVFSIGWSGTWTASFEAAERKAGTALQVKAGLDCLDAYLEPGEEIRTARVSVLFWEGGQGPCNMTGNNKFRRFILAHHARKTGAQTASYPLCGGLNWGDPAPFNEFTGMTADYAKFLIDRWIQFDIVPDAIWLDAGWYVGAADWKNGKNWDNTVGSWTEDPERFPNTLREVTDHAHKRGTRFMVWFEPERVYQGSDLWREHPEWLLPHPDGVRYLLNLGNPEVLDWLCHYMGDFLESRGIDYYRQDFNINPDVCWAAADAPGRKGITEIRHIEGLYAYWDYLLERFPNLLIDNCASGGRRLDLETVGRSAPLWRTDYNFGEIEGYQNQTYGLEWFLPQHGTGIYRTDRYDARSAYSAAMVMNYKLTDMHFSFLEMKRVYDEYRTLQPYYSEDFYPLSGTDGVTASDRWIVYELHRPSDDTGYILAFRRPQSPDPAYDVCLQGLGPDRRYTLTDVDSGAVIRATGAELAAGHTLRLPQPRSCLLLRIEPADE